ncbi:MAG: hypothetical protein JRG91_03275 [Deltaproteobacteria bacterium]|nr:hypothetical protein [Deltaproteobacteria bacterium]
MTRTPIQTGPSASCGNCGAEIPVPPAGGVVSCAFCSSNLYVEGKGTVPHYVYRPAVRPDEAGGHVNRWLFEMGLGTEVELTDCRLVYYPFWRMVRGSRVELHPAAASPVGPLGGIPSPAGELAPYDAALEDGAAFVAAATPPPDEKAWLVHVPVYHASFPLGELRENVLVEATAGRVIAATSPPGTLGRPSGRDGWVLWGGAAVLLAVGAAVPVGWAALAGSVVAAAAVFILLASGSAGRSG